MKGWQVGVDEAGRGPAIGPLVVCALSVPENDRRILREIGVGDSKTFSKKRRENIHREIIANVESRGWRVGLIYCNAEKIDQCLDRFTENCTAPRPIF